MGSNSPGEQKTADSLQASGFPRRGGWRGFAKEPGSRTNRCSEWEPADSPRDKSTIIGGWPQSLTLVLDGKIRETSTATICAKTLLGLGARCCQTARA